MNKQLLTTSNPFERRFGYHRAVRRGPMICVSGTTALKLSQAERDGPDLVEFPGDAYKQAILSMQRCIEAVTVLRGKAEDIARVKMFVARSQDCGVVGDALRECFGTPVNQNDAASNAEDSVKDILGVSATMIVVPGGFVDEGILVEVEVDAFVV